MENALSRSYADVPAADGMISKPTDSPSSQAEPRSAAPHATTRDADWTAAVLRCAARMTSLVEELSTRCLTLGQAPVLNGESKDLVALADRLDEERQVLEVIAKTWAAEGIEQAPGQRRGTARGKRRGPVTRSQVVSR